MVRWGPPPGAWDDVSAASPSNSRIRTQTASRRSAKPATSRSRAATGGPQNLAATQLILYCH
eukprot:scaffold442471_cov29-Prasinocladus_malaysianus.AAC.1